MKLGIVNLRSPDGARRNPGLGLLANIAPDFAALQLILGMGLARLLGAIRPYTYQEQFGFHIRTAQPSINPQALLARRRPPQIHGFAGSSRAAFSLGYPPACAPMACGCISHLLQSFVEQKQERQLMDEQILQSIDFPDGRIVLLDWSSSKEHRFENLICFNGDGSLRWKAALPENSGNDCFVEIAFDNGQLRTNTMSCFALWLDPSTGSAVKTVFTK